MNLRKKHLPKRKNEIFIIVLGIIGYIILLLSPNEGKINFYNLLPSRNSILDVNFTILISLFTIFTAYVIFIYQLIHNRYPVRSITRLIDIDIRNVYFTLFGFGIITLSIWITGTANNSLLLISLFLMISTVVNFVDFIFRYRRFDINSQIKELSKKFVVKIESNEITIDDIKDMINDVDSHFKDSLEKHESYFSISIVKLLSSVLESYIKNRDRIILDKCQNNNDLDELEEEILDMLFKNYTYLVNTHVEKSVRRSFMVCVKSLLEDLIKCDKYSLFENCSSRLESILFLSSIQSSEDLANDIMSIISITYDKITEEECVDVKYEQNIEDFFTKSLFAAEMLIEKNSWLRQRMLIEAINMLSLKVKTANDLEYIELFKKVLNGIEYIVMRSSENSNDMIWGSLLNLGKETVDSGLDKVLEIHINSICDLIKSAIRNQRKQIIIHGSYLLRSIRKVEVDGEIEKLLYEKCKDFTFHTLETFPSVSFLFLPNYKDIITKSIFKNENIDIYIEDLCVLFSKLVRIDKSEILYTYLEEFNQIIEQCEQKDRKVQESLFNIYENILEDSLIFKSFENFKMVLYKLEEVIINMDNAKKLSKRTIKYILSMFSNVSRYLDAHADNNVAKMYLGFLTKLYRNIKSIGTSKEYKLQIINIIFDIGVSAIESKDDDLIRICSNSLGWHAKDLFDADSYESFKSCITSASNLFKLLVELKYDQSLIIFIGTLFVVLGAYLNTKDDKYANNFIISETAKLPEKELLKYSKKLRQYGSSFWDKELEIDSSKEMQLFIDRVLKK